MVDPTVKDSHCGNMLAQALKNEVALFVSFSYKSNVRVGVRSQDMTHAKCVIDTSTGLNLVSESFLHFTWTSNIKHHNYLMFGSASRQPVISDEVILLHMQICNLRIRVWFKMLTT